MPMIGMRPGIYDRCATEAAAAAAATVAMMSIYFAYLYSTLPRTSRCAVFTSSLSWSCDGVAALQKLYGWLQQIIDWRPQPTVFFFGESDKNSGGRNCFERKPNLLLV